MLKRIAIPSCLAVYTGLIGVFLSVRLKAFLLCIGLWELSQAALAVLILLCAGLGCLFARPILLFLEQWAFLKRWMFGVVSVASVLFVWYATDYLLLRPLQAAGVTVGALIQALYTVGGGLLLAVFLLCVLAALYARVGSAKNFLRSVTRADICFLLLLIVTVNLLVLLYAKNSSTIYFWDNAGYWKQSHTLAQQWKTEGTGALLKAIFDSVLVADYNDLILLPIVLWVRVFGTSRYVFLAATANVWLLPTCLLIWGYAKTRFDQADKQYTLRTLGCAITAMLAVPMLFYAVLIGFIDVGGVFPAMAAMLILITSDRKDRDFGKFFLAGILLAAALLLRRWFSFFALAYVLAQAIDGILFKRSVISLLGTLSSFVFTLFFFFQTLVSGKLLADYGSMYAAYAIGLDKDFLLLFRYFGIVMLVLTVLCSIWLLTKKSTRPAATFMAVQAVLCFVLFVRVQTHGQQHLLLYVPSYVCTILLAVSVLYTCSCRRAAATALLGVSVAASLSPMLPRVQPGSLAELTRPTLMPSYSWAAPKRADAYTIVDIMRKLDTFGAAGKTVGVLASSMILNADILRNAEDSLSLPRVSDADRSYLCYMPAVDQRDGWHDTVFWCNVLLVADPIQLHLGEENQAVVALPAARVLSGEGFGAAFTRLEDTWTVGDGVQVYLYERTRSVTVEEADEVRTAFYTLHPQQ